MNIHGSLTKSILNRKLLKRFAQSSSDQHLQEVYVVSRIACSSWHEGRYNIFQHPTRQRRFRKHHFYFPTLALNLQLELPIMHISCSTLSSHGQNIVQNWHATPTFFLKTGDIGDTALSFLMQTISWGQKLSIVQKQTCAVQNNGVKPDLPRWEPRKTTNSAKGSVAKWWWYPIIQNTSTYTVHYILTYVSNWISTKYIYSCA